MRPSLLHTPMPTAHSGHLQRQKRRIVNYSLRQLSSPVCYCFFLYCCLYCHFITTVEALFYFCYIHVNFTIYDAIKVEVKVEPFLRREQVKVR